MSSGTKIVLAMLGLMLVVLVLYYTTPSGLNGSRLDLEPVAAAPDRPVAEDLRSPMREQVPVPIPGPSEEEDEAHEDGLLSASIADVTEHEAPQETRGTEGPSPGSAPLVANRTSHRAMGENSPAAPASGDGAGPQRPEAGRDTAGAGSPGRPATTPAVRYTQYTVQPGDTLSSIARQWYGDARLWERIARANSTVNPRTMRPGAQLRLPPTNAPATPARASAPAHRPAGDVYVVRAGDTLSRISRIVYGTTERWRDLYEANRQAIGPDPDQLKVGMRLRIRPRN